jgi:NADPH:quinone reductase
VALSANLKLDLAVVANGARIACYAAEPTDPALPVRSCMNANLVLRFVLLYSMPSEAIAQAARDITDAVAAGALTELPVTRFGLDETAAAQDAVEAGAMGKVLVIPG